MSPVALEAYLRDLRRDRDQAVARASLLAQARAGLPVARPRGSTTISMALGHLGHLGPLALLAALVRK